MVPSHKICWNIAVDVSQGGSIEFLIRYGADDHGTGRCEDPDGQ